MLIQEKQGMQRVDEWMKYQVARMKGENVAAPVYEDQYGVDKARKERRG